MGRYRPSDVYGPQKAYVSAIHLHMGSLKTPRIDEELTHSLQTVLPQRIVHTVVPVTFPSWGAVKRYISK